MGSRPLRRSDRVKKLVEITDFPKINSEKEKTANNSKQSSEDVIEDKKTEKQDPDVGGRKRKAFNAIQYRALFKCQRIRTESEVEKELKSQNSIGVEEAPNKDCKASLEGRVIDLDQIEDDACPQANSLDGKSIKSGDAEKKSCGDVPPSNGNIANSSNMSHTSPCRVKHDFQNQHDTCHKVTETCKTAGFMENAEKRDVSSNMQNFKFVEFWVPVQISNVQLEQYCATLLSNAMALCSSSKNDTFGSLKDILITNRKCCNHPYTVDPKVQQTLMKDKDPSLVVDVGTEASGKLQLLDHILTKIQKQQLRVIILFQHANGALSKSLSLGHILVDFVHRRYGENSYELVDGGPNISIKKQAAINIFNKDITKFILLLESRACHQSIKLSSVDVIIIFDSELNPSNDIRSLQKLSIGSQSDEVMIFRLYSSSTLEESILKLAENNMAFRTRSNSLRSNYDALLMWGASDLFKKLTEFHSQTGQNISSEKYFLKDVVEEFSYILSHKCKSNDTTLKSIITRVQNCGIYGENALSHGDIKTHLPNGGPPYIFWRSLLEGRFPVWKFVSDSTTPRQRKRPNYILDPPPQRQSGVDGGAVKTRKMALKNISNIEPAQLKTVTEGETGGVNDDGVAAATDESQSSSGNRFWSTTVDGETGLLDLLKPTVSELCNILNLSEDVKIVVKTFLEYVVDNYKVSKEDTSTLQAFMISVCWIGSSIAKNKIDRTESFALAKKHFNFSCEEERAELVYKKLKQVKDTYIERTQVVPGLKDCVPAPRGVKLGIQVSQRITNVDASNENVSRKGVEEFEKINRAWDEKKVSLENDHKVEKSSIHERYSNPSLRSEKLKILESEFANKLEEHERLLELRLEDVKATILADEGPVVAENEFCLHGSHHETGVVHSGHPEVAPTLPETSSEAESHDEPVSEGANDIESTGSYTSEKELVGATVSSEQIGEVPAQQLIDDMEVDVAEKVDSSRGTLKGGTNSSDASHALQDLVGKLKVLESEYTNKLEENEKLWDNWYEELKETMLPGAGKVAAENESSLHGSPHESGDMATPALNEKGAEEHIIRSDSCSSDGGNPVCAAISQDKTPSVQPVSSPASDDEPVSPSSPDPMVSENSSGMLPPGGLFLQPTCEEPTLNWLEWREILEENPAAAESPYEVAPKINALNMIDKLTDSVSPQIQNETHLLEAKVESLYTEKDNVTKFHEETTQRLNTECEKEIEEIVAQISLKYEAKHLEADAAYNSVIMELETNINTVKMSRVLAEVLRCKCQNPTPSHPG